MLKEYKTVAKEAGYVYEEKKSIFIAHTAPVSTENEALDFIKRMKKQYADARHNVYAYLLREDSKNRYSDDKEPQGSAGLPVLDTIRKSDLTDTVLVVTRYFGGVLLGVGGLVRAYTAAAAGAIQSAGILVYREQKLFEVILSYPDYQKVSAELDKRDILVKDTSFSDAVTLSLSVSAEKYEQAVLFLQDKTAGKAEIREGKIVFSAV
ncbi:MAG: YigZ family protein [Clostridia bacterium]|nr:YigZ family protein [Clostridia bacterium]